MAVFKNILVQKLKKSGTALLGIFHKPAAPVQTSDSKLVQFDKVINPVIKHFDFVLISLDLYLRLILIM